MNEYELLYVVSPRLTADEVDSTIGRIQGLIEGAGGEVMLTDNWGRRRLAYPIKHHFEGTYVLKHLKLPPDRTAEFEGALQINEDILRHLFMRGIVPNYDGPPEQELVEVRRPAPRAPRAEAAPPADAPADEVAAGEPAERAPIEGVPAEQPAPTEATAAPPETGEAEGTADAGATALPPETGEAEQPAPTEATAVPPETGEAEGAADASPEQDKPRADDAVPEGAEAPSPATASAE